MAELKFSGWKAAAALLVFGGLVAVRAFSMGDMKDNDDLTRKVSARLMSEYMPQETERMNGLMASGMEEAAMDMAAKLSGTELEIKELKVSYPVYLFSTGKREGVVKVRFILSDGDGTIKDGINYYRFEHNPLGGTWYIVRPTGEFDYYAKFLL